MDTHKTVKSKAPVNVVKEDNENDSPYQFKSYDQKEKDKAL